MNIFGVGLPEMAVIGAVALLVFGPKRLPELGRTLGKTLKGFQSASLRTLHPAPGAQRQRADPALSSFSRQASASRSNATGVS